MKESMLHHPHQQHANSVVIISGYPNQGAAWWRKGGQLPREREGPARRTTWWRNQCVGLQRKLQTLQRFAIPWTVRMLLPVASSKVWGFVSSSRHWNMRNWLFITADGFTHKSVSYRRGLAVRMSYSVVRVEDPQQATDLGIEYSISYTPGNSQPTQENQVQPSSPVPTKTEQLCKSGATKFHQRWYRIGAWKRPNYLYSTPNDSMITV